MFQTFSCSFAGHRNLEETIFNTNIEATSAIARQLRLRNLGGMILIDFIDMADSDHQRRVIHSLESATSKDRAKINIHGFTALGLIEMTRKRTGIDINCGHGFGLIDDNVATGF